MLEEIVDHRILDNAVPKEQGTFLTARGLQR